VAGSVKHFANHASHLFVLTPLAIVPIFYSSFGQPRKQDFYLAHVDTGKHYEYASASTAGEEMI
jgi:hypothetical protein